MIKDIIYIDTDRLTCVIGIIVHERYMVQH